MEKEVILSWKTSQISVWTLYR